jgi:hypothetical protein
MLRTFQRRSKMQDRLVSPVYLSTQAGDGHLAEARLGLFGKAGKNHRDVITDVLVSSAGNNNAIAMDLPAIAW